MAEKTEVSEESIYAFMRKILELAEDHHRTGGLEALAATAIAFMVTARRVFENFDATYQKDLLVAANLITDELAKIENEDLN